jgi:hypothetical protein
MRIRNIIPAALLPLAAFAQSENTLLGTNSATAAASRLAVGDVAQTTNVTYVSYASTITLSSSAASATGNATNGTSTSITELIGTTSTSNSTASSTSTAARPTNTQPCNGYVELCDRSYSNVTFVAAHNFPFTTKNNAARNQELGVTDQLNDGIRMLQAQAHWENETMYFCHTSCDLLNAGTVQDQLAKVVAWLEQNPFEVVSILLGNYDTAVDVNNYVPAIRDSGLERYAYTPSQIPMSLDAWPTIGELIITQKRAVIFMDYNANQTAVPYILDEFSQMWETPFSPTDPAFPCTEQRPPNLSRNQSLDRLYLANHNLNVDISELGIDLLVPNVATINQTNAVSGNASLGLMAETCTCMLALDFNSRVEIC